MTVFEKFKKLEEAKIKLKESFVGLDSIIDDIIKSITPWYITQEILERPTVISLWGMTGTGKTSVVKKLIELLELGERTISFDCGREADGGTYGDSLSDKISDLIGDNDESVNENTKDFVFIFDEFQYAKTIDEDLNEVSKPSLRPIWNIIDDGCVPIYESRYSLNIFQEFLDDALAFEKENPNVEIHLDNGFITDPTDIEILSKSPLGIFHLGAVKGKYQGGLVEVEPEDNGGLPQKLNLNDIFSPYVLKRIYKKLNAKIVGLGDEVIWNIKKATTLSELLKVLVAVRKDVLSPKILNCSKSLVFIVGNLDEAFKVQGDIDHDGDADTFYEITSNVTLTDIKNSLKKRFRAEQISRLGNNLIKYPTLKKEHFETIIDKELCRIFTDYKKITGIDINLKPGIKELIYSEGVCPVQGVRPVFTTINMIITPILSEILIKAKDLGCSKTTIRLEDTKDWLDREFRLSEVNLCVDYLDQSDKVLHTGVENTKLQVGELRSPQNRKTRFACGIHEAGHAIMMLSCTGEYPVQIIAVDTNNGGSCYSFQRDRHNEIPTKRDRDNDILISLGGYVAEKVIFGDNSQNLMGSSSDIGSIWETLKESILFEGYLEPFIFTDHTCHSDPSGVPAGIDIKSHKVYWKGSMQTVYEIIINILREKEDYTSTVLSRERKLLAHLGKYLGEKGSISKNQVVTFVDKYGTDVLKAEMEKSKSDLDYTWYYNKIQEIIGE